MALIGGSSQPPATKYLFIDGGYLRKVREHVAQNVLRVDEVPMNPKALTGAFDRVYYYDCLPGRRRGETDHDYNERVQVPRGWLRRMAVQDKVHVVEGVVAGEGRRARQKQTDVQIAVHALMHAFNRNLGAATLLTGDQDFVPLVKALVTLGIEVTVRCHRLSASHDLVRAADIRQPLTAREVFSAAPRSWQETFAFPRTVGTSERGKGDVIAKGASPDGDEVFLLQDDGRFVIGHPDNLNWGHWFHTESEDEGLLRRVHEDVYFRTSWEEAGAD